MTALRAIAVVSSQFDLNDAEVCAEVRKSLRAAAYEQAVAAGRMLVGTGVMFVRTNIEIHMQDGTVFEVREGLGMVAVTLDIDTAPDPACN